jgi:hypothetical protein
MPSVRIWVPESDYDEQAVRCLAENVVAYLGTELRVYTAGERAYTAVGRKIRSNPRAFVIAVEQYLKQDDYLIFVMDRDSPASLVRRKSEPFSKINLIEYAANASELQGRVFLSLMIEELEAWLLIDCFGICCYFAGKDCSEQARAKHKKTFYRLAHKYQRGNTEHITEPEPGGKNAKEYLESFSEAIIRHSNPRIRHDTLDRNKYHERLSPELAKCIEINTETLARNPSFKQFVALLQKCSAIPQTL